jgi:hypothetical protein
MLMPMNLVDRIMWSLCYHKCLLLVIANLEVVSMVTNFANASTYLRSKIESQVAGTRERILDH